jgi:uncharacterized protein YjbJ (UPF0337 family)
MTVFLARNRAEAVLRSDAADVKRRTSKLLQITQGGTNVSFGGYWHYLTQKEFVMGATIDKIKGVANEAAGKAKQGIGEATGSAKLQGEGAVQEATGHGQKAVGDAKSATKDAINKAADAANRKL